MSGGGGSGGGDDFRPAPIKPTKKGRSGGGAGDGGSDPCDIDKKTILNSPDPAILKTLKVGEVLKVEVASGARKILEAKKGGNVAGSVTFPEMGQVIECIESGEAFEAEVVSISGGQCQVRVHRV